MLGLLGAIGQGVQQGSKQYIDIMDAAQDRKIKQAKISEAENETGLRDELKALDPKAADYKEQRKGIYAKRGKADALTKIEADELALSTAQRNDAVNKTADKFAELRRAWKVSKGDPMARGMVIKDLAALGTNGVKDGLSFDVITPSVVQKDQTKGWAYVAKDKDGKEVMRRDFNPYDDKAAEAMFEEIAPYFGDAATRAAAEKLGLEREKFAEDKRVNTERIRIQDFANETDRKKLDLLEKQNKREYDLLSQRISLLRDQGKLTGGITVDDGGNAWGYIAGQGWTQLNDPQKSTFKGLGDKRSGTDPASIAKAQAQWEAMGINPQVGMFMDNFGKGRPGEYLPFQTIPNPQKQGK